jgi:prepilin-type processing-associated H-X9-DG protein/prepilin-type N-terminal cleavage/methylation domain-containing protein
VLVARRCVAPPDVEQRQPAVTRWPVRTAMRHAFTLVELLVVVGIIALLIAMLMPVLNKAREHAQTVRCAANLREIGNALTMYVQSSGYYPGGIFAPAGGLGYAIWPTRLRATLGREQRVFYCPAQDEKLAWPNGSVPGGVQVPAATAAYDGFGYSVGEPLLDIDRVPFSYSYNLWGAGDTGAPVDRQRGLGAFVSALLPQYFRELKASRIKVSSDMIAITDSSADGAQDFGVIPTSDSSRVWPGRIHNRGANALFCDGHVQWYRQADLLVGAGSGNASAGDDPTRRRRWNNDNRP